MKVILHIGAHRTGTISFQSYIRRHSKELRDDGLGFWGPMRTRKGLFAGVQPTPGFGRTAARRARGRILLNLKKAQAQGVETLFVSDENMMGSVRMNLRKSRLYPDIGERLARYIWAFDQRIDKIVLSGGVFNNNLILTGMIKELEKNNLTVFTHTKVPTGDGGISLGQVVSAAARIESRQQNSVG